MKVLFFLLDGESNASTRHRVLQYFPLLRAHGIEPVASRPVPEWVYQRLVERPPERRRPPPAALEHTVRGVTESVTRGAQSITPAPGGVTPDPQGVTPDPQGVTPGALGVTRAIAYASSRGRLTQSPPGFTPVGTRDRAPTATRALAARAAFYSLFLACRTFDVLRASRYDAVVIQRDLFPFGPPWLERLLLRRNPRLVYDTDDATYLRPSFTPNTPFQRLRHFEKVAGVVSHAAWVSAATPAIADWARQYCGNVSVVPMAIDLAEYDRARELGGSREARSASAQPLVIGWAGTAGGVGYLRELAPVLADVCARHDVVVRVISGGYLDVCLPGVRLDARPWRARTALRDMAEFDIGIVPLDDTPFERAKFPFKLLQYLALGVPALSARVGFAQEVIRDGENGLLAGTHDEWREALEALITDASLRTRLALAGRETVVERYTVERVGPLLVDGLRRVGG